MIPLPPYALLHKTSLFEPITLAEMSEVQLLNRSDRKFLLPIAALPKLLDQLHSHYRILEVEGHRFSEYQTLYFDTSDFRMYHAHQSGRLNRYKVRQRHYVHTDTVFTEVKFKNNKGRTIKSRLQQFSEPGQLTGGDIANFVNQTSPFISADLQPILWVDYTRITLVSLTEGERLTLDLNLTFRSGKNYHSFPQLVVAEIKKDLLKNSFFLSLMKQYGHKAGAMSKYCLGVVTLFPHQKHNRFKPKLQHLKKIIAHHDTPAKPIYA